jgi:hypothetical protein
MTGSSICRSEVVHSEKIRGIPVFCESADDAGDAKDIGWKSRDAAKVLFDQPRVPVAVKVRSL